ncbi:MAG: helix-turn-helix domain-containing protein [Ruminococcus sp.]|nr:helix-turn-helix domain-containing protein [Ruminococcus sp.]
MKVYQKVALYIAENGVKQKFISDKTGIAENTLSMILNGKRKMDADEFVEIIIALGVDANYFIINNSQEKET